MAKKKLVYKKRKKRIAKKARRRYILLALFCVLVAIGAYVGFKKFLPASDPFMSDKYFVKGIDVSHHNPILNWDAAMEDGISFAYIKSTEGTTHIDRNYIYNYELAKSTNIKVGAYHFYSFAISGKEQAQHFIANSKFEKGDMIPVIDVEHSPVNPFSKDDKYVALVVSELKILENELYQYLGVHPLLYTNKDCYKLYIKGNFTNNMIWMCDLDKEPAEDVNWRIWQFSHKGKLRSINEDVDLNYYRYSFDKFEELLLP